jgi:D-alanyl-D-alanine carboxypeptidase
MMPFTYGLSGLFRIVLVSLAVWGLLMPAEAEARVRHPHHPRHAAGAAVARSAGYADLVIDGNTGLVLHATNAESQRHPASLTKMMTLYITFQALEAGKLRLDQRLWVSENASEQSPTKLGLLAGQSIRVQDAILGLVTESANDAAVVLAEAIGGSEDRFAQYMTRQARALGMSRTNFQNPNGLPDPDQVTCAADMVRLGYALIHHYPQYYRFFSEDSFVYAGVARRNHNHLMERYDGMDGIKTGYIRTSGFNLVASAARGQTRLIAAVFGGRSASLRDKQMEGLLDQGFASAPASNNLPVVRVGQSGDVNGDGALAAGDYLSLPQKVPAVFAPANRMAANDEVEEKPSVETPVAAEEKQEPAPARTAVAAPQAPVVAKPEAPKPPVLAKAEVEAPKTTSSGRWAVQIGAYADPAVGRIALQGVARQVPALRSGTPILQQVRINNSSLYRARYTALDERTARSTCATLTRERKNCIIVMPAG